MGEEIKNVSKLVFPSPAGGQDTYSLTPDMTQVEGLVGQTTQQGGEIFNHYAKNFAMAQYSSAEGTESYVNAEFYFFKFYTEEDKKNNVLTLYTKDGNGDIKYPINLPGWAVKDMVSIINSNNLIINGSGLTIKTIDVNKITLNQSNFDSIEYSKLEVGTEYRIWNRLKPDQGSRLSQTPLSHRIVGAHAEGFKTASLNEAAHSEGRLTVASGRNAHAEGGYSKAQGEASHAEGYNAMSNGYASHAEGNNTLASGENAHAEGHQSHAVGKTSHAEGSGIAYGEKSHAEGAGRAHGVRSHAEGYSVSNNYGAFGNHSHVEGTNSITGVNADSAHAEGNGTKALGTNSHAEGDASKAEGENAHAEGGYTEAQGKNSHAEGWYSIAKGRASHVEGKYNLIDDTVTAEHPYGTYAHILGNGTESTSRSNAHTIDWNGNAWFAGNVKVGGTSDANAQVLVTKNYVDSLALNSAGAKTQDSGEIFNDYKNNYAMQYGTAQGQNTGAGIKGYYWFWDTQEDKDKGIFSISTDYNSINSVLPEAWEINNTLIIKSTKNIPQYEIVYCIENIYQENNIYKIKLSVTDERGEIINFSSEMFPDVSLQTLSQEQVIWNINNLKAGINIFPDCFASHSEGNITVAIGKCSHAEGHHTIAGDYSHAEGYRTYAAINAAHAEGRYSIATGNVSHAEGYTTIANGYTAHAEGFGAQALGTAAHAEGGNTKALADASHTEGINTTAKAHYSHAEGYFAQTEGYASHAEGCSTIAQGFYSHSEGMNTQAIGSSSHAEGLHTTTRGSGSHAEGANTMAVASSCHAEGLGTVSCSNYQHVAGKYNMLDGTYNSEKNTYSGDNVYAYIIGNGTGEDEYSADGKTLIKQNRSNAHTVDWDGNGWFASDVKVGGTSQFDEQAKILATQEYVDEKISTIDMTAEDVGALPINQGVANVGKLLIVGTDGNILPAENPEVITNIVHGRNSIPLTIENPSDKGTTPTTLTWHWMKYPGTQRTAKKFQAWTRISVPITWTKQSMGHYLSDQTIYISYPFEIVPSDNPSAGVTGPVIFASAAIGNPSSTDGDTGTVVFENGAVNSSTDGAFPLKVVKYSSSSIGGTGTSIYVHLEGYYR